MQTERNNEASITSNILSKEREYWNNKLSGEWSKCLFPYDYNDSMTYNQKFSIVEFGLPIDISEKIIFLGKNADYKIFTILMSFVNLLLHKYSDMNDIIIGMPIYKQQNEGEFINTVLAIRNQLDINLSYKEMLVGVSKNINEAIENQNHPINRILYDLGMQMENKYCPLFDVAVLLENIQDINYLKDIMFNIYFIFKKQNGQISGKIKYNSSTYKKDTILKVVERLIISLKETFVDLSIEVKDIKFLSEQEENDILYAFNDTVCKDIEHKTLQELFEEQVEKTPDNIAIKFENYECSYSELNSKSNQIARCLRKKGVKAGDIVCIMVERSIEMIAGIIGILKSGAAYLPIEPNNSYERINFIINDSKLKYLIIKDQLSKDICFKGNIINLKASDIFVQDDSNVTNVNMIEDLAYIIYTSGTTGYPKGVMIEHGSISNTIQWRKKEYNLNERDTVLQLFSYSFDGFLTSFFTPIISGSKNVLLSENESKNPYAIKKCIVKDKVSHFICVPSLYNEILEYSERDDLNSLRIVTLAGEKANQNLIRKSKIKNQNIELVNEYGPTENSVVSTYFRNMGIGLESVIGKSIANVFIYILDKNNNIVPIGIEGELCISGRGLAKGYLNRDDLNRERFVENPIKIGEKMYKTGDIAKWNADGNIEFIGRKDDQVKIRGFRIEVGEIEDKLRKYECISAAIVLPQKDTDGNQCLCSYFVAKKELTVTEIRDYLSKSLPEYMIPSFFVQIYSIPFTSTGKVNRKALTEQGIALTCLVEYEEPSNEVEEKLVNIWKKVLSISKIGINDNFFELGGHSLKATNLIAKIHKELNFELTIDKIFKAPTIKQIAQYIQNDIHNVYSELKPAEVRKYYWVSTAQKRMYLLNSLDGIGTTYNATMPIIIEGEIDKCKFENAIRNLVQRHESLRTSFEVLGGDIVQRINNKVEYDIEYVYSEQDKINDIINDFVKPFNINNTPLFRIALIELTKKTRVLIWDIHHIITDGVSISIIFKELFDMYNGVELNEHKITYKDFAVWQNEFIQSKIMKNQEDYWLKIISGDIPVLNLPIDYFRPSKQSFNGDTFDFEIDEKLASKIRQIARKTNTTTYMILLSAFYIMLSKYSNQDDIIIGTPVSGRTHADTESIVGLFVNTVVMRNYPSEDKNFAEFLDEVKNNAIGAFENQDYPFDNLLDNLKGHRDLSRNPLFDVMFAMQNFIDNNMVANDLTIRPFNYNSRISKFDITLEANEVFDKNQNIKGIKFRIEYCTRLFKQETIERMAKHLLKTIDEITKDVNVKISDIEIISAEEKVDILERFNSTEVDFSREKTIHKLFEEQVEVCPEDIAVIYREQKFTYRELNKKSNQLAKVLREKGVRADKIVGIMAERSLEMVVGVYAILKAGGAYLPIDTKYPLERIRYMLDDSEVELVLTQSKLMENVDLRREIVYIDDKTIYKGDGTNLGETSKANNLAYVIYTSGSTGNPKGVAVEHGSTVNVLTALNSSFPLSKNDAYLLKTPYIFDVSVSELFGWFLGGGRLVVSEQHIEKDIETIIEIVKKEKITHINFVPSMFNKLIEMMENEKQLKDVNLKYIFLAGEVIPSDSVNRFYDMKCNAKLINLYGPTEATIYATWYSIFETRYCTSIPIGTPVANTKIYIVDKYNRLQPVGVQGELCIEGDGLARGYINMPELTEEKFVPSPLNPEKRMYKTGDLARWLPDGNLEFIGRIDYQVKIRGYRIELAEIENHLLKYDRIQEVVVVAKEDPKMQGEKYLCAYMVADKELTVKGIREHLLKELPSYMIPSYLMQIDNMPLTNSGKVDRKYLPEHNSNIAAGESYDLPENEVEEKLVEIWEQVLHIDNVGTNNDFFELGGHSLKITSIVSLIHKEFNIEASFNEIFNCSTIKKMGEYIKKQKENKYTPISCTEISEWYPLSSAQRRVFTLHQLETKSIIYNIPGKLLIEGQVDKRRLEATFNKIIKKHESLRTSFEYLELEPMQKIHEEIEFEIKCVNLEGSTDTEINDKIVSLIKPFNLNKAPLMRVYLCKVSENKHILVTDIHHIICDGVSSEIILKELEEIYEGKEPVANKIQYKDYAVWQNGRNHEDSIRKQEEYWMDSLNGEIPVINIPLDYIRPIVQSFEGDSISIRLNKELTQKINEVTQETGTTLYMTMLAAYNILLARYGRQEDIIVGSTIAGRTHADLENIVGMFVNTLALRNYPSGEKTFKEFLEEVKVNSLKAFDNQECQFDRLIEKLKVQRKTNRNPLFDVMFNMRNIERKQVNLNGLKSEQYDLKQKIAKFDMTLEISEVLNQNKESRSIELRMEYCTKLFEKETIERMLKHLLKIIEEVTNNTNIKISEIDMITTEEKQDITGKFNNTGVDYPREKTIHKLFEDQVEICPEDVAVKYGEEKLTYRELNEKSNQLAKALREKGVKADRIVGIMVERSLEMVIGVYAILKAGGAYLPIDTKYPIERIRYMLDDSEVELVLTQSKLVEKADLGRETICIDDKTVYKGDNTNLEETSKANNLAYIIYTSGSTGNPKGVAVEHGSTVNVLTALNSAFPLSKDDAYLLKTPYIFDVSVSELFSWFFGGGKLVISEQYSEKDIETIIEIVKKEKVTHITFVPAMFNKLIEIVDRRNLLKDVGLKYIFVGGEVIPIDVVDRFYNTVCNAKLINLYGPTETTIYTTWYWVCETKYCTSIPIGGPIANTKIHIIDKYNRVQPIGVQGELCIEGDGLAREYINMPELTEQKFVPNPFNPGKRMYKTGDLARWLPDGKIEFLGRVDNQVKIRGYRIELAEIENHLLKYDPIKEVAVVAKGDPKAEDDKYLCAYMVSDREVTVKEIREHLLKELPSYMVPSCFIRLDSMPLTNSGKIDRKSLPELSSNIAVGESYDLPENEIEEKLVGIWKQVLNVDNVGINNDFFELGGHSLKMTIMVSLIHKEFNTETSFNEIFNSPTIKKMSEYIKKQKENKYAPINCVEISEWYPLSSAQKRVFMLHQLEANNINYNIPGALIIEGQIDKDRLEAAFSKIIQKNESLRTSFEYLGLEPMQKVHEDVEFKVEYVNLDGNIDKEINSKVVSLIKPFKLNKAPLMRVYLCKISKDKHILVTDIHHIICDGISGEIILKELEELYEGKEPEILRIQYKDYAVWQNERNSEESIRKQEEYWMDSLKGEIPVIKLPLDYVRPIVQSFEGDNVSIIIDQELTEKVREVAQETGTTLYMIMLVAYNILLARYSGQDDIIVGSPIAGRTHADLENIVGMFVNTLALRNYPVDEKTFKEFLEEVKGNSLKAFDNQECQFERLVDKLKVQRNSNRNPLFDVMFNMQNLEGKQIKLNGLKVEQYDLKQKISKFDMTLEVSEVLNENQQYRCLELRMEYCTKLFKEETINRMLKHLEKIIEEVTNNINVKISEIDMITAEGKQDILERFNNTRLDYPREKTIHKLFEEQVEICPEDTAVIYRQEKLTYRELNEKSNQLAKVLREKGVKADKIVGIMVERSLEMIVGLMGILKAGGAYLPIDTKYPMERIRYMFDDSEVEMVLTQSKLAENADFGREIVCIDDEKIYKGDVTNIGDTSKANNLAYIIYTSGSTGNPKGVMVEHRSAVNFIKGITKEISFSKCKKILTLTSISFDIFFVETLLALAQNMVVVIADEFQQKNPELLSELILSMDIDMLQTTPSGLKMIEEYDKEMKCLKGLSEIMVGGENLPLSLFEKLKSFNKARIYNMYGPTEATIWSSICDLTDKNMITIGQPISNTQIYILNKSNRLQSIGVPGELCIGGEGVARGYLNRPELTEEKFILNPYRNWEKIYKTGDLARWLPDGNLEFLGRIDHQVKIRGHRIELGEIENYLLKCSSVQEAVVVAKEELKGDGEKYLCAYIVSEKELDVKEIREQLLNELPNYMIPSYFVRLDSMPLTHNKKIDRKSLPEPDMTEIVEEDYEAPKNEIEERLVDVWKQVLKVDKVGVNANFFRIGGDSLKAIRVVSKMMCDFDISVNQMFRYQTIRGISHHIRIKRNNIDKCIELIKGSFEELEKDNYNSSEIKEEYNQYNNICHNYEVMDLSQCNIYENMLITGSTGYLGMHIVRDILVNKKSNIYLLIRGKTKEEARLKFIQKCNLYFGTKFYTQYKNRIFILQGDLTSNHLGITEELYEHAANLIDCVINSAANVSHFGHYSDFYEINVRGVDNLIDFAFSGKTKTLCHISTTSVGSGSIKERKEVLFTEYTHNLGQNISNYYVSTKLEAEKRILAASEKGLSYLIFRVGHLVFDSETGIFQQNIEENAFYNLIKSFIELKMMPTSSRDLFDFSFVDYVSRGIGLLFDRKNLENETFHLYNSNLINLHGLGELLRSSGLDLELVSIQDFFDFISKNYNENKLISPIENLIHYFNPTEDDIHTKYLLTSRKTEVILNVLGFYWDELNDKHIKQMVEHCKCVKYI